MKQHRLTWNENKFEKREQFEEAISDSERRVFTLSPLMITKLLNLPKKYVIVVLSNLFNVIGLFLEKNKECVIELANLGSIYANNKLIYHYQRTKIKSEKSNFKKNTSVQSLVDQPMLIKDEKSIKIDKETFDRVFESNHYNNHMRLNLFKLQLTNAFIKIF